MRLPLLSCILCILLAACQSDQATRGQRAQLKQTARVLQNAMNARSATPLEPILAPDMQFHGLPPELSLAGLRSGAFWPTSRIARFEITSTRRTSEGPEANVAFDLGSGVMLLRLGIDPYGRIRFIDEDLPWWSSPVTVSRPFTSDIVISNRLMFIKGSINGKEGFLLLDTGASTLLLNQKYFAPSGDPSVGISASISGMKKRLGHADVASLRWGSLRAANITGELHDFTAVERPAVTPLIGAISHDELKNCAISIDWRQRKVQVSAVKRDGSRKAKTGGRPPDIDLPFSYFSFFPVIDVEIGPRKFPLLFDSGASLNILPDAEGLAAHFRLLRPVTIRDGGRGEGITTMGGFVDEVRMGGAVVTDMPFVIHQTPYLSGKGFLGVPLLERYRVEINFPARRMSLWR